jgi:hypothetical protein
MELDHADDESSHGTDAPELDTCDDEYSSIPAARVVDPTVPPKLGDHVVLWPVHAQGTPTLHQVALLGRGADRQCGDWRHTVRHVLINDMPGDRYGKRFKCHAPAMIEMALDRLARIIA